MWLERTRKLQLSTNLPSLKKALGKRAQELGIRRIHGEFISFAPEGSQVIVKGKNGQKTLFYDLLIGATGAKGVVKKELGIPTYDLGKATGVSAVDKLAKPRPFALDTSHKGDLHLRRLVSKNYVVVFAQSKNSLLEKISRQSFLADIEKAGWEEEAKTIAAHKEVQWLDVPIHLTQAKTFASPEKNAIIIGDSAATASFFKGRSLNTAILTSRASGKLIKNLFQKKAHAFKKFDQKMKEITDTLINQSRPLFSP